MKLIKIFGLAIFTLGLSTQSAFSDDWEIAGYGSLNVSSSSHYILHAATGDVTVDAKGKATGSYGAEGYRIFSPNFSLGLLLDETYFASDDVSGTDQQLSVMLVPKVKTWVSDKVNLWAGLGIGTAFTSYVTTRTDSTGTISFNDRSSSSFVISPRVGVDYKVYNDAFIGFQAAFLSNTSSDSRATAATTTAQGNFRTDVQHNFWSLGIRVGVSFGNAKADADDQTGAE